MYIEKVRIYVRDGRLSYNINFYLLHTAQIIIVSVLQHSTAASGLPHNAASICLVTNEYQCGKAGFHWGNYKCCCYV